MGERGSIFCPVWCPLGSNLVIVFEEGIHFFRAQVSLESEVTYSLSPVGRFYSCVSLSIRSSDYPQIYLSKFVFLLTSNLSSSLQDYLHHFLNKCNKFVYN